MADRLLRHAERLGDTRDGLPTWPNSSTSRRDAATCILGTMHSSWRRSPTSNDATSIARSTPLEFALGLARSLLLRGHSPRCGHRDSSIHSAVEELSAHPGTAHNGDAAHVAIRRAATPQGHSDVTRLSRSPRLTRAPANSPIEAAYPDRISTPVGFAETCSTPAWNEYAMTRPELSLTYSSVASSSLNTGLRW